MALQSMTALANITLQSATNTVTFSNISQNYRDLFLVLSYSPDTFSSSGIRFNGDSGSNYTALTMRGGPTNEITSSTLPRTNLDPSSGGGDYANSNTLLTLNIPDYSSTDKQKSVLMKMNNIGGSDNHVQLQGARWANTAAINTITIFYGSGNYKIGSTFDLYGRIA